MKSLGLRPWDYSRAQAIFHTKQILLNINHYQQEQKTSPMSSPTTSLCPRRSPKTLTNLRSSKMPPTNLRPSPRALQVQDLHPSVGRISFFLTNEYIRYHRYLTNEYPNIFGMIKRSEMNIRINLPQKKSTNIWRMNIFVQNI